VKLWFCSNHALVSDDSAAVLIYLEKEVQVRLPCGGRRSCYYVTFLLLKQAALEVTLSGSGGVWGALELVSVVDLPKFLLWLFQL